MSSFLPHTSYLIPHTFPKSIDYLVIGQGLCGTFLCWELEKANKTFLVIDEAKPFTSSKIAAGIINPVTGRRFVKTWMIDRLMPFAMNAYKSIGNDLGIECIQQKDIVDFFPGPQMRMAFLGRLEQDPEFLAIPGDSMAWRNFLNYEFDYGIIQPCYLVDVPALLHAFRNHLILKDWLIDEHFEEHKLVIKEDGIEYRDISAGKIIFCDGISSTSNNYFSRLPFAPNKGEVLIARIKDLPATHIFKKGINIVPWKDDVFWIGSSHEWQFETDQPTILFRDRTIAQLTAFLKLPFTIIDHWAAVRPATLERRPFIGFHPLHSNIGIFNGMGMKGCSLAPFFANALARHLTQQAPLPPEADIHRFKGVLRRS